MGKSKAKEILLRVVILLFGLTIAHLGVTLFLLADIGSDPFNVLIQGLFRQSNKLPAVISGILTHGRVHIVICLLIIVVLLIVDRTYVRIGTILCMICGGPIIDFFNMILGPLFEGEISLLIKIIVNILGCVILAFGMTIVIKSEAGTGPNDLVAIVISDKLKFKFSWVRVVVDLFFALSGFILGGTVGLGTIICAFVVGPVAGAFMPFNEKRIKALVARLIKT
ncbi:MAG: hypothetical protein MJ172_05255 [Clostridia bacterium]|nr:hypothetical protein [Clostridia bacterium]